MIITDSRGISALFLQIQILNMTNHTNWWDYIGKPNLILNYLFWQENEVSRTGKIRLINPSIFTSLIWQMK